MRDPARINRILEKLGRYWHRYPDARLGQLVSNWAHVLLADTSSYYLEDDQLEAELDRFLVKEEARREGKSP